jgi:hypothetical protein
MTVLSSCGNSASKEINSVKIDYDIIEMAELEKVEEVGGAVVGLRGNMSEGWRLYKIISENYPSETIEKDYFKTNSIVAKIYLYWILRERNWDNLSVVYDDLQKYGDIKIEYFPLGDIGGSLPVKNIIKKRLENYFD